MAACKEVTIGGIVIRPPAGFALRQTYDPIGGIAQRRLMNGDLDVARQWRRLRTTISGQGWIPSGLAQLDEATAYTLRCGAPRSAASASNVIPIPAARRADSDYTPYGISVVGEDAWLPTEVTGIVADVATLATVSGATQYHAVWFPQFEVYVRVSEIFDRDLSTWSWTLTCEEA
jgi:hypothetical protein